MRARRHSASTRPAFRTAPGSRTGAATLPPPRRASLHVRFALAHDLLCGEVDAARGERVADEEVVALRDVEVAAVLHVRGFRLRERQLDGLRHDVALERRNGGLDGDSDLRGPGARRCALQAFRTVLAAELAKAVLRFTTEGHEGMLGVDHRLHDTRVPALRGDAVEMLVNGDRIGGDLLRGRVVPLADDFDDVPLLAGGLEHLLDAF